jgi:hypothetical protein
LNPYDKATCWVVGKNQEYNLAVDSTQKRRI